MRIAILDPAAGISGDMTLGALLALGVPQNWLEALPGRLGFEGVAVTVRNAVRCGVGCKQVEFTIPERAHGRHVGELVRVVERAPVSDWVKERAVRAFQLVGDAEGRVHGVAPEKVHLHEVGAVDAVLDIVGAIEGFEQLGVEAAYAWPVAVGNGWVESAHGRLPVPAPATAILLEGVELATGGPVEGEATTPTGAALVRVLAAGSPPGQWRMMKSGGGPSLDGGAGAAGPPPSDRPTHARRHRAGEGAGAAGCGRRASETGVRRCSRGGPGAWPAAARGRPGRTARRRGVGRQIQGVSMTLKQALGIPACVLAAALGGAGAPAVTQAQQIWLPAACDIKPGHQLVNS